MILSEALEASPSHCAITKIWGRLYAVRKSRSQGYQWDLMHLSRRSKAKWITASWFPSLEEIEQDLSTLRGYKPEMWEPQATEVKSGYD